MTTSAFNPSNRPLRMWPAIVIAVPTALMTYVAPRLWPDGEIGSLPLGMLGVMAGALGGIAILLWWLFFSRARWSDRLTVLVMSVVAVIALPLVAHQSIAGAGRGMMLYFMSIPGLGIAITVAAMASRRFSSGARRLAFLAAILLACLPWAVMRTGGVIGGGGSEFHWRWTPTAEEMLLSMPEEALVKVAPATPPPAAPTPSAAAPVTPQEAPAGPTNAAAAKRETPVAGDRAAAANSRSEADKTATGDPRTAADRSAAAMNDPQIARIDWPGFRGPNRDSVIHDVRVATDWTSSPPVELWRKPVGPGWSSFAVHGDRLYTQEQRGADEIVACYRLSTGEPVWRHRDAVRFWESNGGAGPRGTPTLHGDRVYAFGATGILNALDAQTGSKIWSRNVAADTKRALPEWGFTSSPLIVGDIVVVAAAGTLAAYDVGTGELRWRGPSYGGSYSSPHLATIDGVIQILQLGGPGAISVAPDGTVLWEHKWSPGPIVQPAVMPDGDVVINTTTATGGIGTRRLHVTHGASGWQIEERWTSSGLKPFFNDFVLHKGHAFGFDGSILSSINLEDGSRNWKGGRYGNGQMLLLADQDLLLVISEDGELALVSATTDGYRELARFQALDAKTWNHPVLVNNVLLVRNGEEMAAFRMPMAERETR